MRRVQVRVVGCDDETLADLNVDEQGLAAIRALALLTWANSQYGCMPRVYYSLLVEAEK